MSLKVNSFLDVQKVLDELSNKVADKKDIRPTNAKRFSNLAFEIREKLDEGEIGMACDESSDEFLVFKRNGKLYKIQGTEVE